MLEETQEADLMHKIKKSARLTCLGSSAVLTMLKLKKFGIFMPWLKKIQFSHLTEKENSDSVIAYKLRLARKFRLGLIR